MSSLRSAKQPSSLSIFIENLLLGVSTTLDGENGKKNTEIFILQTKSYILVHFLYFQGIVNLDTHGFSALPGGRGYSGGNFSTVGGIGNWWSASEGIISLCHHNLLAKLCNI
jgi:hypothetical protein